ncbi:50S ribosomal protein L9 [Buchnera aphidicola]|nr:50S ribosomal protein L9 [Buchnera aphidicola]
MKIILLKDIPGLGQFGHTVVVKSGYARNYLVPYGMATFANFVNIKELDRQEKEIQLQEQVDIQNAQLRILEIKKITPVCIFSQARSTGKLFGSIGVKEILQAIKELGISIKKNELIIYGGLIRKIGNYNIVFQPYKDISCYITINIISKKS